MIRKLRCLIVDDEPLARQAMRDLVALDPELELVGEAQDGDEALQAIAGNSPDLVFLDVQMPEVGGFEVLQGLELQGAKVPITIFVTAYDQYALRAFEAQALDYLLKPVDEKRFSKAVLAAKARLAGNHAFYTAEQLTSLLTESGLLRKSPSRIPVKGNGRIVFVRLDEVEWIEAEGNYLRLHLADESYLLRETMNSFEGRIDPEQFMRIHRSAIVNLDFIRDVQPWFTGEYIVRMRSGKELTLTRSYRHNLKRLLGQAVAEPDPV